MFVSIVAGGSIATLANPLPQCLQPNTIKTFSCSNNDAFLAAFSVTVLPPTILSAFNLQIDTYGRIRILGAGSYAGVIPTGGHTFNSQTVTYYVEPTLCDIGSAFIIDPGFTNISIFQGTASNLGIRDTHVNDNFNGTVAESWTSNSTIDKTLASMNLYIAMGSYGKSGKGKFEMGPPQNLTKFQPTSQPGPNDYTYSWDSAIAINRKNSDVIVASVGLIPANNPNATLPGVPAYFISRKGGKCDSWEGPHLLDSVNFPPNGVAAFGDNRGVLADEQGNFWYSTSLNTASLEITNLFFYFSSDLGATWTLVYVTTDSTADSNFFYDYPQIVFGTNGAGQSGLWFQSAVYILPYFDYIPRMGFIPATGQAYIGSSYGFPGDSVLCKRIPIKSMISIYIF